MSRGRNPIISDILIKDMTKRGLTLRKMMAETNCYSYTPIYNALKRNGLLRGKGRPKTIDNDKVIELYKKGEHTAKEIAIKLNCSLDRVYKLIKEYENGLIKNLT